MTTKLGALIFLLAATLAHAQTNNLTALLQQGLFEEQANRNLDAAIADYQSLALQFDKDRQLAATAVFRLGECYRMQGKTNEAALEYKRIVNEFSDQTPLVTLSRQNLTGLGPVLSETVPSENSEAKLWNKVKNLPQAELEDALPTLVPDAMLTGLLQQRSEAETKLAELRVDYSTNYPDYQRQEAVLKTVNRQIEQKIDGILQALKMRAELPQTAVAAVTPSTDEEDQEIRRIQQMIQNSPDLINAPINGSTPLVKAAYNGWLKVAAYLLDHGANANGACFIIPGRAADLLDLSDSNAARVTPLVAAVMAGNKAMAQFLIDRGADVNFKGQSGDSPLHLAAQKGFQAVIEVLLASRADVKAQNTGGATPLCSAVQSGQVKIVRMLLAAGADGNIQDSKGRTVLNYAIRTSPEIIQALLVAGTNPNTEDSNGRTPLSYAAEKDSSEVVKLVLAAKADPNGGKVDAPLLCAIGKNDTASAELLLQAGAKPNSIGKFDLPRQSGFGGRRGGPFGGGFGGSPQSVTPLWLSISESMANNFGNQLPMVQLLLKFKADPNDLQTDGQPLLFSALSDTNILGALLDAGAKVDAMGVSPNARVGNSAVNWTPLGEAAQQNNATAVETLLKHGANPNARDPIGNFTPLHWAANNLADRKVFELLLAYKADRNVRDVSGQTPLDILKEKTKPDNLTTDSAGKKKAGELADLLRQHGALDNPPNWDCITVSRPSANVSLAIFRKGTNDWNQFTLLDTVLDYYMKSVGSTANSTMPFPDLTRVIIVRRSHGSTNETRIVVSLLNSTNGIDCSKDLPLEFGDVVEIPEREHSLEENSVGLTDSQRATLADYVKESAQLVAHGQKVELPFYRFGNQSTIGILLNRPEAQKLLLSSSDLSHVKVIRRDLKDGKTREWILDCSNPVPSGVSTFPVFSGRFNENYPQPSSDLLLRNGDVIEVPEKP